MLKKNDCNMNSTLEVFNIGKKYKNRPVLRNVSLNVRRGEAVGLLGPNGAGKTTCFYCVTGLITPDYGDVHIDGQDIPTCRCTAVPAWVSATCRRKPPFSVR